MFYLFLPSFVLEDFGKIKLVNLSLISTSEHLNVSFKSKFSSFSSYISVHHGGFDPVMGSPLGFLNDKGIHATLSENGPLSGSPSSALLGESVFNL